MSEALLPVAGTIIALVALVLAVPVLVLLFESCAARRGLRTASVASGERPRLAVLMPAHDEASGIRASIESVQGQLQPEDCLLVVADNCSDETADVAQRAGAQVIVRRDPLRTGKGFALDFGVRHLAQSPVPPEVVVIVDADCLLGEQCLDRLAPTCATTGGPTQALYLMRSPPHAGLGTRFAEFAWVVKNHVRPLGLARFGFPCQLMGTGMAFPWVQLRSAPLASGHIVEDLELGLALAERGSAPTFCAEAVVTSTFPSDASALRSQRTRWEHGHLGVIRSHGGRLLKDAVRAGRMDLAALALDLCVPPLASLALLLMATFALAGALALVGGSAVAFGISAAVLAAFAGSVLLAWSRFGRTAISLRELALVPAYVLAKVPVYARFVLRPQSQWVRTRRDRDESR